MKRVFVSYSRKNLEVVTQLIEELQAIGIHTWHDQTLTGGQLWWDNILTNIRECDIFIFALSPESIDSEACKSELHYVAQLKKTILPVLITDGINLNLLSHPLHEIQVTDYRRRDKGATLALFKSINDAGPSIPLPDPLPASPPVPISYMINLKEQIDSAEPLNSQSQIALLWELEQGLGDGRSQMEIRDLLLAFKRRDDLLAKVAQKLDVLLNSMEIVPAANPNGGGSGGLGVQPRPPVLVHDQPARNPGHCPKCNAPAGSESKFCGICGAALMRMGFAAPNGAEGYNPARSGWKCRRYACEQDALLRLLNDLKSWLNHENFDSQQMDTEDHALLLQIKKRGGWRDFVGMATSLNVVFKYGGDTLMVEIGAGKWIDKAAVGTVSMFILWPLAVTAGYGAWEQAKLPDRIFDFIGTRLSYR